MMRQKNIVLIGVATMALVAAGGAPAYAQSTTDKMEQKAHEAKDKVKSAGEETKDKAKSLTQEAKTELSDSWITSKTKIALFADDRVKGRQVHVDTENGTVMLRGKVDSAEAKSAAGDIAKDIDGVKSVKNELQVVPPSERKAVNADDKQISKRIEDRFKQDPQLKASRIDAKVNGGVVTLTGEVKSITTSARASEVARSVPGVRYVKNDITYGSQSSLDHARVYQN
jgi:hyperosmotically inducible protein